MHRRPLVLSALAGLFVAPAAIRAVAQDSRDQPPGGTAPPAAKEAPPAAAPSPAPSGPEATGPAPPASDPAALRVLSAGAMEPGLAATIARFRASDGGEVSIAYATAPQLRERLAGGETPDLLIAPVGLVNELAVAGRLAGDRASLGRVGIGAAIRKEGWAPDIQDMAALKQAIEEAERIVYNRASTGNFLDRVFEKMGVTATVAPKAVRYATGAEVMRHVGEGSGRELGLGPVTEILMAPEVRFLGPLPAEAQGYTAYAAALLPGAAPAAAALLALLSGPEGRSALATAGIEPVP